MSTPWIVRAPGAPYFMIEGGAAWHPVGQNDSVAWPEFSGLRDRSDLPAVARHLAYLAASGVTVLRLMLEYGQDDAFYFERPVGCWNPAMVLLWDDLFALCAAAGLRILLTPLDTFFLWNRFHAHPWAQANGGPVPDRSKMLTHAGARAAIKARLAFATGRWGGSGTLFAWDLYNEMHPAQGEDLPDAFAAFIDDVGPWLRALEMSLHGRAHLQTVSVFGPELQWKPWLRPAIFRSPHLDFANSHFYDEGTIDDPRDAIAPAVATGRLLREALAEIWDGRPFFDTEHGPIHTFKDHGRTLPEPFDDAYFRAIQWAHVASGGAGGGMRWPNRDPHQLTPGMRRAQRSLSDFLPLMDWLRFRRAPLDVTVDGPAVAFGCGDGAQAIVYARRTGPGPGPGSGSGSGLGPVTLIIPAASGAWDVTAWNPDGVFHGRDRAQATAGILKLRCPALPDVVFALHAAST